jgi:peptide-methionine (S)-S-oxide reductase
LIAGALVLLLAVGASGQPQKGKEAMTERRTETATLAGGCFWCVEAVLEGLKGVESVVSGYSGGGDSSPTYEHVSTGRTGHAESVQITFDPAVISYGDLLRIFFAFHDPTTKDRQGADVGPQYRSAIFWHTEEQRDAARAVIAELETEGVFDAPIVTELAPYEGFHSAEDYHQDYYRQNAGQPYCRLVISPKLAKLRKLYSDRLKDEP